MKRKTTIADATSIEWTATPRPDGTLAPGYTFNPWIGCQKVSAGCAHCYAETMSNHRGWAKWGPTGTRVRTAESNWKKPLKWNREAGADGVRRKVFCASLADVFEDRDELIPWRRDLASLIWATPHLDWLLLTKRPEHAERMIYEMWFADARWPRNFWLGTSVEDQRAADERIPHLLRTPAPVRFLSVEPLLGPVDLRTAISEARRSSTIPDARVDWIIVGGESGPGARPCRLNWIRAVINQCRGAEIPVFCKQLGSKPRDPVRGPEFGLPIGFEADNYEWDMKLRDKKGGDMTEWPADIRVREFPASLVPNGGTS